MPHTIKLGDAPILSWDTNVTLLPGDTAVVIFKGGGLRLEKPAMVDIALNRVSCQLESDDAFKEGYYDVEVVITREGRNRVVPSRGYETLSIHPRL